MRPCIILTTAAAVGVVVGGCATQGPQPTEQLSKARTLIEQAEKAQAQRYAAPDLQRARDELNSAEQANNQGSYDAARAYAESAAVDADVAAARASAGEALRAAHEAQQSNSDLQQESEHAAGGNTATTPPPPARSELEAYPPAPPGPPAPPPPESSAPEPQTNPQ
jgi:predicted S18 family serine protease